MLSTGGSQDGIDVRVGVRDGIGMADGLLRPGPRDGKQLRTGVDALAFGDVKDGGGVAFGCRGNEEHRPTQEGGSDGGAECPDGGQAHHQPRRDDSPDPAEASAPTPALGNRKGRSRLC